MFINVTNTGRFYAVTCGACGYLPPRKTERKAWKSAAQHRRRLHRGQGAYITGSTLARPAPSHLRHA